MPQAAPDSAEAVDAGNSRPLKMKDLEARTGIPRETIHFYLREGLLPEPERPKRNVAHYNEGHVLRLKLIKRLQEERHLPLGEIRHLLDKVSVPAEGEAGGLAAFELTLLSLLDGDAPQENQTLETVAQRSGLSVAGIEALGRSGAIRIRREGRRRTLDFRDAAIVEQWGRLLEAGFSGKPGYDADYLGRMAEAARELARWEVDVFLAAFGSDLTPESARLATRGIGISNEILTRLRTQAVLRRLSEVADGA